MLFELTKGKDIKTCNITLNDIAEKVADSVSGMEGVTKEKQEQIKKSFISLAGGDSDETA